MFLQHNMIQSNNSDHAANVCSFRGRKMTKSINDSLFHDLDFPLWSRGEPNRSIMFAATPRCGGTYMCMSFWKTGLVGAPLEYTNAMMSHRMAKVKTGEDFSEYWINIQSRRTSPNGVFSFKMFPYYFYDLINNIEDAVSLISFDTVVYLYRKDILAQAVSHARALQTQRWFEECEETLVPSYSFGLIKRSLKFIVDQTIAWERIFRKFNIKPYSIPYEDFICNKESILEDSIKWMGIGISSPYYVDVPDLRIQRDYVNKMWKERFLLDAERSSDFSALALCRSSTSLVGI